MRRVIPVLLVSMLILTLMDPVHAQTPQEALNQYVSDLRKNPNDYALREKIIKHVQIMPAPLIPEEARRYFIEGNALLKAAKEQKGYGLALEAYRQCLLIAPWWAEAYYNYAVALDLANQFDEAVNALKLYIAANPGEGESRKAQDKIYEIGAKKKLAALSREGSSSQTPAAPEQDPFEALLKKIDGRRYRHGASWVIDVRGKVLLVSGERIEIRGRETTVPSCRIMQGPAKGQWTPHQTYIIGEDGDRITLRNRYSDGDVNEYTFFLQR